MAEEKVLTGRLYDIQGFSVQDGPGVRTTAFLKGCPLRCPWCHSPESQAFYKQLSWMSMRCQGVDACDSRCIKACPKEAIELGATRKDALTGDDIQMIHVKRDICDNCGKCEEVCYPNALYLTGKDYTVEELVQRLLQDRRFYEKSGGGVTISGGECLCQPEFTTAVFKRLKEEGIHTACDTTGFVQWEQLERTLPYTDLYLYDLKHMDNAQHEAVIKVPNPLILENVRKLAAAGAKMQIRIPTIPMFNDSIENMTQTAEFCKELGDAVTVVQPLPYHNLGVSKYARIDEDKTVMEATPPSDEKMQSLKKIFDDMGVPATIH